MKKISFSMALALSVVGAACGPTTTADDSTSSSSSSTSGNPASSTGSQTSSRASSTGGVSGTSGGSSGVSGTSGGSSGTSGGSSGTSGGSSGTSGNPTGQVLGGPCDPPPAMDADCTGAAAGAMCAGIQGETTGICVVPGCTAGATNCAGPGTVCSGMGAQTACVKSCTVAGGDGQCGAGAACVNFSASLSNCYPLDFAECVVTANPTGCPMGESCAAVGSDGFGQCASGCDLFLQNCGMNEGCYPGNGGSSPACFGSQGAAEGATCMFTNDCAPGSMCVSTAAGATCRKFCDMTHACTDAMRTCAAVGATGISVCAPSM